MSLHSRGVTWFPVIVCVLILVPASVYGQSQSSEEPVESINRWGVEIGIGPSTFNGPQGSLVLRYEPQQINYSLRMAAVEESDILASNTSLLDFNLLAGIEKPLVSGNLFSVTLSTGISGLYKKECVANCGLFEDEEAYDHTFGIGLPLEAGLNWKPFQLMAIGVSGIATLNTAESYAALNLHLSFGKLR